MESILLTIAGLFFILNVFGINFNETEISIPAVSATENFEYRLMPAEHINFPYRVRGVANFDADQITAESAVVIDENTGRILFEKDSYTKSSIASLTKLMTALVWWEIDGDMDKVVEIESSDYREGGIAYFISGEKVRAKDLIYTALVASSNSGIAALVRSTGLSEGEFVELMNKKAGELGMKNTRFKDPTGLDFRNISTATDLFILSREAFKNPLISHITQLAVYEFRPINKSVLRIARNTNWLLSSKIIDENIYEVTGGKTGYIEESNYNLILKINNKKTQKKLIIVILGSIDKQTRFTEAQELMEWAYKNHIWQIN